MFYSKIKKFFTLFFESKYLISKFKNKYQGKQVLLLGDGISAAYSTYIFQKYDYIIVCNNSINHKDLENCNILFHIIMEPDLLKPGKNNGIRKLWKSAHKSFPNTKLIMSPFGRFFNFLAQYKNVIFFSPYHNFKISDKIIYSNFTAAFQASLGIALICGFKKIDILGFDAWLLTPKNNLRWYENVIDPSKYDFFEKIDPEDFILKASKIAKLSVFTYHHYQSNYSFIEPIQINNNLKIYNPSTDRFSLMRNEFKVWVETIENN